MPVEKKYNENNKIDKNIKEKQIMASVIYLGRQMQTKSTMVVDLLLLQTSVRNA